MTVLTIAAIATFVAAFLLFMFRGKTFLMWPQWVRLTIMGSFVLLWGGWIVALNLQREATEITFDTDGKDIEWTKEQLPLGVCLNDDLGSHKESAEAAVKLFNDGSSMDLLSIRTVNCNIEIQEGSIEVGTEFADDLQGHGYYGW